MNDYPLIIFGYEKAISILKTSLPLLSDDDVIKIQSIIDNYSIVINKYKCDYNKSIIPTRRDRGIVYGALIRRADFYYLKSIKVSHWGIDCNDYKSEKAFDEAVKLKDKANERYIKIYNKLKKKCNETDLGNLLSDKITLIHIIRNRRNDNLTYGIEHVQMNKLGDAARDHLSLKIFEVFNKKNKVYIEKELIPLMEI